MIPRSRATCDFRLSGSIRGPNISAEERATLCRLRLYVSEENACRFFDPGSNSACDHVTVPAVHLAEGLATDWWSIFGGRDREHPIRRYRTGFALPDVTLGFDGSTLEVRGEQLAFENPDVRFWHVGSEGVVSCCRRVRAGGGLSKTLRRGCRSPACRTARWLCAGRVSPDRSANPDERAFCEAAGALGGRPVWGIGDGREVHRAGGRSLRRRAVARVPGRGSAMRFEGNSCVGYGMSRTDRDSSRVFRDSTALPVGLAATRRVIRRSAAGQPVTGPRELSARSWASHGVRSSSHCRTSLKGWDPSASRAHRELPALPRSCVG